MKHVFSCITVLLLALSLTGCDSLDGNMTPVKGTATTTTTANPSDLLIRKWTFSETTVKTNAKSYEIPTKNQPLIGDDNTITFIKGGTFTYLDGGKTATGRWTLVNQKLTMTDADNVTINWTVNKLTATELELASLTVNLTKGTDLTNSKIFSPEEQDIGTLSLILLYSLDKQAGGTIDFTKEPEVKTVQTVLKGK